MQYARRYVKYYRDIVRVDVDMLLPDIRPALTLLDWISLLIPFCIGLGTSIYHLASRALLFLWPPLLARAHSRPLSRKP